MVERPPQPEHFASAPPPPGPRVRRNVLIGVVASLLVAGMLVSSYAAQRSAARAAARPDPARAAHLAVQKARNAELQSAAHKVALIKQQMHALAIEAGVVGAAGSGHPVETGVVGELGSRHPSEAKVVGAVGTRHAVDARTAPLPEQVDAGELLPPVILPPLDSPVPSGWIERQRQLGALPSQ